jgi:signal transduction histidine kinase
VQSWSVLAWPVRWWGRQSLRARLTIVGTAIFSLAVLTGTILILQLQRYALLNVLDSSAQKTATSAIQQLAANPGQTQVEPTSGGVTSVQIVNDQDVVIGGTPGVNTEQPVLNKEQLADARGGARIDITDPINGLGQRVLAARTGHNTVLVVTDLTRVDDSIRVLRRAALIGDPLAVLLMGLATYLVAALTLRPVAELRHGAADITAAGLAEKRLPVPGARDEIHRLAVTLNAMLDRIDSATRKQRTFVGDAAHELRSPLASLRVQLEVAQRIGPDKTWSVLVDDVLEDVSRLDRLVEDLLALARMDESRGGPRREPVALDQLLQDVCERYTRAEVPVRLEPLEEATVQGDTDALLRVVVNLIDNAVRYASSDVSLGLRVQRSGGERSALITVTDDGPGIPDSERERVFDRFYRLEQSRSRVFGGNGLGLAIVQDLVRTHGGTITLRDRPDHHPGLVAEVSLPL